MRQNKSRPGSARAIASSESPFACSRSIAPCSSSSILSRHARSARSWFYNLRLSAMLPLAKRANAVGCEADDRERL
jgi:hypothetical protein